MITASLTAEYFFFNMGQMSTCVIEILYIHMFKTILANDWQMSKEKYPVESVTKLRCFIQTNPLEEIVDCMLTILDQGNGIEYVANSLPTCMMSWWPSALPLPEHRNNGSFPLWYGTDREG